MSYYLAIISPLDSPLYEAQFPTSKPSSAASASATPSGFPSWSTLANTPNQQGGGSFPAALLGKGQGQGGTERHVLQMIANSSLDVVEDMMVGNGSLYLKSIDRFNEWTVSAFVAPCVKFVLLHDLKNEDGIRLFFMDVWESYVKSMLNPFQTPIMPIQSPAFENRIRGSARRNL